MADRLPGVSDLNIHIQPWHQLEPSVAAVMREGKGKDHPNKLVVADSEPVTGMVSHIS